MKIARNERHTVISTLTYDVPDEEIIKEFGSLERFGEIISHLANEFSKVEPKGEPPTDEELDKVHYDLTQFDYDREDDWVSDRKGGYDVDYEIVKEV